MISTKTQSSQHFDLVQQLHHLPSGVCYLVSSVKVHNIWRDSCFWWANYSVYLCLCLLYFLFLSTGLHTKASQIYGGYVQHHYRFKLEQKPFILLVFVHVHLDIICPFLVGNCNRKVRIKTMFFRSASISAVGYSLTLIKFTKKVGLSTCVLFTSGKKYFVNFTTYKY